MLSRRAFVAAAATSIGRAQSPRPNLVLFLSDDHGYLDSPVYGSRAIRTPHLEKLAASGLAFSHAFSGAAICIPSRAILASGLCSHRNGAIANGRDMRADIKTLPSYLTEAGYQVAHFGKSHFLPVANYKQWEAVPSETPGGPLERDLDTKAFDSWLANRRSKDPLCLIVCSHSPHVIWDRNTEYDPAQAELPPSFVDTPETRSARVNYYTDITKMDNQLGEVHASVQRHLGANSLFLYTSDNGPQWPFAKWNLYDAGIRLPMIASWPGVIRPRTRTDAMIHFTDLLPTFLELAGARAPQNIDGISFARVLKSSGGRHRQEIFASHTADNNSQMNCYPMRALRTGHYKYIRNLYPELTYHTHFDRGISRDGRDAWDSWVRRAQADPQAAATVRRYHQRPAEELYDLRQDPHELHNLAANPSQQRILQELRRRVDHWMNSMDDRGEIFGVPRPLKDFQMPV